MSQQQQQRPSQDEKGAIKYGDVFQVSEPLASKPVAPQDAAAMQAAENLVLGKTQKGGPAAVMQSAAAKNEREGLVSHDKATTIARNEGVTVAEADIGGTRVIIEAVGDEVVGQYVQPSPIEPSEVKAPASVVEEDGDEITIGEALEVTALSAGNKVVEQSDAAAIQAAEVRAAGVNAPGGVGAAAQSAATHNLRTMADDDKVRLSDILSDASVKLPIDKPVTREDAEGIISAEIRNNPDMSTYPGGVAASVAAAAKVNHG